MSYLISFLVLLNTVVLGSLPVVLTENAKQRALLLIAHVIGDLSSTPFIQYSSWI